MHSSLSLVPSHHQLHPLCQRSNLQHASRWIHLQVCHPLLPRCFFHIKHPFNYKPWRYGSCRPAWPKAVRHPRYHQGRRASRDQSLHSVGTLLFLGSYRGQYLPRGWPIPVPKRIYHWQGLADLKLNLFREAKNNLQKGENTSKNTKATVHNQIKVTVLETMQVAGIGYLDSGEKNVLQTAINKTIMVPTYVQSHRKTFEHDWLSWFNAPILQGIQSTIHKKVKAAGEKKRINKVAARENIKRIPSIEFPIWHYQRVSKENDSDRKGGGHFYVILKVSRRSRHCIVIIHNHKITTIRRPTIERNAVTPKTS